MDDILQRISEENRSEIKPQVLIGDGQATSTTAKTTTTTTTSTTTTTPMHTDAPAIMTENLVANAGEDIHVYYPAKTCILNGTKSRISPSLRNEAISWIWTKQESSPAFGVS